MTSTDWIAFDLGKASAGMRIGLEQTDPNDTSWTGLLGEKHSYTQNGVTYEEYTVKIGIYKIYISETGVIRRSDPENASLVGQAMKLVETTIPFNVGTEQARTRGQETGYDNVSNLTSMEPRDHFAVEVLGMMLRNIDSPDKLDDANIYHYCDAAYRWANIMMIPAADARKGTAQSQGTGTVEVNQGDLQSNTEKLLYNMVAKMTDLETQLTTDLDGIKTGVNTIAESFVIPHLEEDITIRVSIYKSKYVRLEVLDEMCYSDVAVYMELNVMELDSATSVETSSTREVGFIIPRGSVVVNEALDDGVSRITGITVMDVRGKGAADPNTYILTTNTD